MTAKAFVESGVQLVPLSPPDTFDKIWPSGGSPLILNKVVYINGRSIQCKENDRWLRDATFSVQAGTEVSDQLM